VCSEFISADLISGMRSMGLFALNSALLAHNVLEGGSRQDVVTTTNAINWRSVLNANKITKLHNKN